LRADTALLTRLVPAGCGLSGARTRYAAVRAAPRGRRIVVSATARLAASQLVCHGRAAGAAPSAGPTRLRLELLRTAAGLRIAALRTG
jgi:hypothetical protein